MMIYPSFCRLPSTGGQGLHPAPVWLCRASGASPQHGPAPPDGARTPGQAYLPTYAEQFR